jgi:hypothetical protein
MNNFFRDILFGGLTSLVGAVMVDLDAWRKADAPFDWKLAATRWIKAFVLGLVAGCAGADTK